MKFFIRDILLVTVIVALALGWWLDRSRLVVLAQDAESHKLLAKTLVKKFQFDNSSSQIFIAVNGQTVSELHTPLAPMSAAAIAAMCTHGPRTASPTVFQGNGAPQPVVANAIGSTFVTPDPARPATP